MYLVEGSDFFFFFFCGVGGGGGGVGRTVLSLWPLFVKRVFFPN